MKTTTQFLPLITNSVNGYTVSVSEPTAHSEMMAELYAKDCRAVAEFTVDIPDKENAPKGRQVSVQLYYRTDRAPLPYGYGRNGEDGGELSFGSCVDPVDRSRGCTELTDWDGAAFLPKSVCAVLRALGFTVSDENLGFPL